MTALNPTTFAPTSRTVEPDNRPDHLAAAVLASLDRSRWGYRGRPWGIVKTVIASVFTMGLLPLIVWPWRMAGLMVNEQQQLWHLAEWLRLRTGRADAASLRDYSTVTQPPNSSTSLVSFLIPVSAILVLCHGVFDQRLLIDRVWAFSWHLQRDALWDNRYLDFWKLWTLILCAGYFFHWFQLCRHAGALAQYAHKFNEITASENIPPVHVPGVGLGFHPLWTSAALVGLFFGAVWALPLSMAAVVHTRYVRVTSRHVRGEFAGRVRTMLLTHRPALDVRRAQCVNNLCRAPIPPGAAFCPRCGARTT